MSPMTRNVLRALTTVFTTVLAITVLTHIMVYYQNKDKDGEIQGFDEAFFFIAVSSITGLSSDIEPDTWFTRGIVLFVMFIGIFWLPPRVSEMLSLWQDRSPWPAAFEAEANQSHVLVIGDLEYTMLFEFLREFFCEDHGIRTVNTVVVVMSERSPGKEVAELLSDPAYVNRVKFVLGSPTSFKQLGDVDASGAQAIFLLSSKAAGTNAAKEDAAKVMIALAVRKYLKGHGNPCRSVPIFAQVLLPETTLHLEYLADHVICVEELRLGLLAKSVMVPGFASLLQLLTASIPDNTTQPLIKVAGRYKQEWLAEYAQSMSHEIYSTRVSPMFNGVRFQKAAQVIFQRTGATLFAIRVPDRNEDAADSGDGRIMLNPSNYELQGDELGFVLASNSLVSTQVAFLAEESVVSLNPQQQQQQSPQRSAFLNLQPIVILSPAEPSPSQLDDLARFGSVYVVSGSPLSRTDLARVRIHRASCGIVLANREEALSAAADVANKLSLAGSDTTATATADAPALLSVLNIEALTWANPDFFLSVEFIHRENMQFVGDSETIRINEVYAQAFLRPSFMSGRVYTPVMLDTLICQAYYNEYVLEIMQRLIFSHGNVVHALGLAKLNEAGVDAAAMVDGDVPDGDVRDGHVFLVEVPARFHGRSYSSLFSYCCFNHAAVPIGLYRAVTHHRQPLWYVMPNPAPACVLREDDRVYLIASTRPSLQ
ncbi:hypothetical protein H4R26_001571 [Coemansia thaxteri]|uniref:Calcium-activated potassium channel BK alpha subunit domain-containing protein n=1 Tax=Coemansia thaxteri TaxID=2663907 RepID=A0A9W8BIA8_9FUNG|nr:hypothetical protein H4R26_001571 [Coemansia thaxteri]